MADDIPTYGKRSEAMQEALRREEETGYLHEVVEAPDGWYRVEPARAESDS